MKAFPVTDLASKAAEKQQAMVNRQKAFAASAATTSGVISSKESASFAPVQAQSGPLSKAQLRKQKKEQKKAPLPFVDSANKITTPRHSPLVPQAAPKTADAKVAVRTASKAVAIPQSTTEAAATAAAAAAPRSTSKSIPKAQAVPITPVITNLPVTSSTPRQMLSGHPLHPSPPLCHCLHCPHHLPPPHTHALHLLTPSTCHFLLLPHPCQLLHNHHQLLCPPPPCLSPHFLLHHQLPHHPLHPSQLQPLLLPQSCPP